MSVAFFALGAFSGVTLKTVIELGTSVVPIVLDSLADRVHIQFIISITFDTSILLIELRAKWVFARSLTVSAIQYVVWPATKTRSVTIICFTVGILNHLILVLTGIVKLDRHTCVVRQFITSVA